MCCHKKSDKWIVYYLCLIDIATKLQTKRGKNLEVSTTGIVRVIMEKGIYYTSVYNHRIYQLHNIPLWNKENHIPICYNFYGYFHPGWKTGECKKKKIIKMNLTSILI